MIDEATAQRFWSQVNKESGKWWKGTQCWEWTTNKWGEHPHFKGLSIHRFHWMRILKRPIPKGLYLHHNCENKQCVNDQHLKVVSPSQHGDWHSKKRASDREAPCWRYVWKRTSEGEVLVQWALGRTDVWYSVKLLDRR